LSAVRPEQVLKILEVTDSFNLHRESVFIPLKTEANGSVSILEDGRLQIVCPSAGSFVDWLSELRIKLGEMDLSRVGKP
jgi:hypothetical protein